MIATSTASVTTLTAAAARLAVHRARRPGFTASAPSAMTGSTTIPLSRSSTTDANGTAQLPISRVNRRTRSTSPPIVDSKKFPTR